MMEATETHDEQGIPWVIDLDEDVPRAARLYGLPGAENMLDSKEYVAERAFEDGYPSPITIEEYTTKPIRSFVKAEHLMDRLIEYDLEEALDEYGAVAEKLEQRIKDPAMVALFDAALDRFLADLGWCWADKLVATWTCTWEIDEHDDHTEFVFTEVER